MKTSALLSLFWRTSTTTSAAAGWAGRAARMRIRVLFHFAKLRPSPARPDMDLSRVGALGVWHPAAGDGADAHQGVASGRRVVSALVMGGEGGGKLLQGQLWDESSNLRRSKKSGDSAVRGPCLRCGGGRGKAM